LLPAPAPGRLPQPVDALRRALSSRIGLARRRGQPGQARALRRRGRHDAASLGAAAAGGSGLEPEPVAGQPQRRPRLPAAALTAPVGSQVPLARNAALRVDGSRFYPARGTIAGTPEPNGDRRGFYPPQASIRL